MHREGKIADSEQIELLSWNGEELLRDLTVSEVRFSRGFLRSDLRVWLAHMAADWQGFFARLGKSVSVCGIVNELEFPRELTRVVPVEINQELAIIGLSDEAQKIIVNSVVNDSSLIGADIIIEYLERRLLSSISSNWQATTSVICHYLSSGWTDEVHIIGASRLDLEIDGQKCSVWFGFGPQFTELLDKLWCESIVANQIPSRASMIELQDEHTVSIELTELAVPPAMLIDYMRSGTTIDLEIPFGQEVMLRLDGIPWALAELCQFNGKFCAQIVSLDIPTKKFPEATTRVQIEIARIELDSAAVAEHQQIGAVLLTRSAIVPRASMIIGGENIASAVIGTIGNNFALSVLPK